MTVSTTKKCAIIANTKKKFCNLNSRLLHTKVQSTEIFGNTVFGKHIIDGFGVATVARCSWLYSKFTCTNQSKNVKHVLVLLHEMRIWVFQNPLSSSRVNNNNVHLALIHVFLLKKLFCYKLAVSAGHTACEFYEIGK